MSNVAYDTLPPVLEEVVRHMPYHGFWLETASGRVVDLLMPNPDQIDITDIAWALSRTARFAGNTNGFYPYSVASHSVWVANYLLDATADPRTALYGLLHDAAEAYLGDIPSPVKQIVPEIYELEARLMEAIYCALDLPQPGRLIRAAVKRADRQALAKEVQSLVFHKGRDWPLEPLTAQAQRAPEPRPVPPFIARNEFYAAYLTLRGQVA